MFRKFIAISLLIAIGVFVHCGGSALPQISLPAPSNDCSSGDGCITVSSPDADGRVTITASVGAVPESSIVNIRFNEQTSRVLDFLDSLIPSAQARACNSALPECASDGSSTTSCHITANVDGSFLTMITADDGDTIEITYLDGSGSCEESESFETEVTTTGLFSLDIEGAKIATNSVDVFYVFGENSDGLAFSIVGLDEDGVTVKSVTSYSVSSMTGNPVAIDYFTDGRVLLVTDEEIKVADMSSGSVELFDTSVSDDTIHPIGGFVQRDYTFATSQSQAGSECLASDLLGTTSDRIIAVNAGDSSGLIELLIFDSTSSASSSDVLSGRSAFYDMATFTDTGVTGVSSLAEATLEGVSYMYESHTHDGAFVLSRFLVNNEEYNYLIYVPIAESLCTLIAGGEVQMLPVGSGDFRDAYWIGGDHLSHDMIMLYDAITPSFIAYDTDYDVSLELELGTSGDILEYSRLNDVRQMIYVGNNHYAAISGTSNYLGLLETTIQYDDMGLMQTAIGDELDTDYEVGINPIDMILMADFDTESFDDPSTFRFVVLSQGNEGDGVSSLRIISGENL